MGHAQLLKAEYDLAKTAYAKSIEIRNELGQPSLATEPKAGLIEVGLATDNYDQALLETESLLNLIGTGGTLDGTDDPLRVYYACYMLLKKIEDPRSKAVLQTAKKLLDERVSKFSDESARRMYIENLPWRRALHQAAQFITK
jgi:hypothetical protein